MTRGGVRYVDPVRVIDSDDALARNARLAATPGLEGAKSGPWSRTLPKGRPSVRPAAINDC